MVESDTQGSESKTRQGGDSNNELPDEGRAGNPSGPDSTSDGGEGGARNSAP